VVSDQIERSGHSVDAVDDVDRAPPSFYFPQTRPRQLRHGGRVNPGIVDVSPVGLLGGKAPALAGPTQSSLNAGILIVISHIFVSPRCRNKGSQSPPVLLSPLPHDHLARLLFLHCGTNIKEDDSTARILVGSRRIRLRVQSGEWYEKRGRVQNVYNG